MPQGVPQHAGAAAMPVGGYAGVYVPPPSKRWPWVVGALLASILAVFGLQKVGFLHIGSSPPKAALTQNDRNPDGSLRAGGSPGQPLLQEPGSAPPPVLQAPGDTPPPILQMPATVPPPALQDTAQKITMPKDVEDWLKWLEKIEREKRVLASSLDSDAAALMQSMSIGGLDAGDVANLADPEGSDTVPAVTHVSEDTKKVVKAWKALDDRFWTVTPPAECRATADSFSGGLKGLSTTSESLNEILQQAMSGVDRGKSTELIQQIKKIQSDYKELVDDNFSKTDSRVQTICEKYETRKWFDIDAGDGDGGILKQLGH